VTTPSVQIPVAEAPARPDVQLAETRENPPEESAFPSPADLLKRGAELEAVEELIGAAW
jgi:hypothetical protein